MSRNIVILNGSPRPNGNTVALIESFTKGAQQAGHTIMARFDLNRMNLHPCLGCCGGGKDAMHPCVQRDDMEKIYEAYQKADLIVLASPLYYWNVSGQLKCAIDRLFAIAELDPNYVNPHKAAAMLMAAEDTYEHTFTPMRNYFDALCANLGWENCGGVFAGGNLNVGDIQKHPEQLEQARVLGASL
jgi:multimeric flavodoxin WrbA